MEKCEAGCPCDQFDCNLSLNVTDPVVGLEYLGIFETSGKKCSENKIDTQKLPRCCTLCIHSVIPDLTYLESVKI